MEIGSFVRGERKRRGWTQQELADKAGVGLNFVYQLEKNKPTVQLSTTNQVLKTLGYRVGVLRDFDPWAQAVPHDYTGEGETSVWNR
jgi:y4mF family transcriptional regulator